jgi:hypothetical protein
MVKVKDVSDAGLGIESPLPLKPACFVLVTGTIAKGLSQTRLDRAPAKVTHCKLLSDTCYYIGLEFRPEAGEPNQQPLTDSKPDYYDILQLSPKADPETIHRVYRLLAQRYHPDNQETGEQENFRLVLEAYKILSDPETRAAYDATIMRARQLRWKIFDQASTAQGREGEIRKRAGVLSILYAQRMNQPQQVGVTIHELEDLLGCPREHLEFTLWYLKETACVTRSDNGRYAITAKGVDVSESVTTSVVRSNDRLLASGG